MRTVAAKEYLAQFLKLSDYFNLSFSSDSDTTFFATFLIEARILCPLWVIEEFFCIGPYSGYIFYVEYF